MLTIIQGNLFDSNAQTIVNAVNCVGVMGKGIALEFKTRYPDMYDDYQNRCRKNTLKIGQPYLYQHTPDRWILNFPTKNHWRNKSKIEYLTVGLEFLHEHYKTWNITSIAFPLLGAGFGGLDKTQVKNIMIKCLSSFEIPVQLYL
jgi:O-acetyl-ADP-ribose deacetylase (regulator of RNase III)